MSDNRPIGVFDSGLGGLTVVAALRKALPQENIFYLGDTARVPYGDKSIESITGFACNNTRFLINKGVKAVVAACNTVSAVAFEHLKKEFDLPIINVLEAGVKACLEEKPQKVTVIGTRATVNSDAYRRGIHKADPRVVVESIACPLFVPLAEEGLTQHSLTAQVIDYYLSGQKSPSPDILLLGCTHYPLLLESFREYFSESVKIVDSASACAAFTADYLNENNMAAAENQKGCERFYVTDLASDFHGQASRFLGKRIRHVEKVIL